MKLHLPKSLLAAVLFACATPDVWAAVSKVTDETTGYSTYTWTGSDSGNNSMNLDSYTANDTVIFQLSSTGTNNYFQNSQDKVTAANVVISDASPNDDVLTGLILTNGWTYAHQIFTGSLTGNGVIQKLNNGTDNKITFEGNATGYTGNMLLHTGSGGPRFTLTFGGRSEAVAAKQTSKDKGAAGTGYVEFNNSESTLQFNYTSATNPVYITNQIKDANTSSTTNSTLSLKGGADYILTKSVNVDNLNITTGSATFEQAIAIGNLSGTGNVKIQGSNSKTTTSLTIGDYTGKLDIANSDNLTANVTISGGKTLKMLGARNTEDSTINLNLQSGAQFIVDTKGTDGKYGYSYKFKQLMVTDAGTISTLAEETGWGGGYQGQFIINDLQNAVKGQSATLNLKSNAKTDQRVVFELNGGDYTGTINLTGSNTGTGRKTVLNINNSSVAENAVVHLNDNDKSHVALAVGKDSITVKGITGSKGSGALYIVSGQQVYNNSDITTFESLEDKTRTLVINTGEVAEPQTYSTNATIKNYLNITKQGNGTQIFNGDTSGFNGAVDVQGGTLGFGSSALGTAGVKVATGATLSYGGDKLSVTGKGGVANLGAASFSVENSSNTVIISGGNSGITATNALLQLEEGASLKLSNVTISESSSVQGYGVAAPVVMAADGTGNTAITRNSVTLENTTVKLGAGATVPAVVQATAGNVIAPSVPTEIGASAKVYTFTSDIFNGVALKATGENALNVELSSALTDALYGKGYDYVALSFENSTIVSGSENSISVTFEDETLKQLDPSVYLANNMIYIDIQQIPEPATATLSLLALVALAARRRRK